MQAEGREWVTMFSPETIAKFDYVFTDSMTWTNDRGKRMRLWIPNEVEIGDKQAFMDMLVERAVGILTNEPIDIYVNPTFLPEVIASGVRHALDGRADGPRDPGGGEERRRHRDQRAVSAARARSSFAGPRRPGRSSPSEPTTATRTSAIWPTAALMARKYNLTRDDFFVPKPDGQKPIQVKGLAAIGSPVVDESYSSYRVL